MSKLMLLLVAAVDLAPVTVSVVSTDVEQLSEDEALSGEAVVVVAESTLSQETFPSLDWASPPGRPAGEAGSAAGAAWRAH